MNWDGLLESFGKFTTECHSTQGSLEDVTRVNPLNNSNSNVDITELLFDNTNNVTKHIDYDLTNIEVTVSPFEIEKSKKNGWANVADLQPLQAIPSSLADVTTLPIPTSINVTLPTIDNIKLEGKSKAIQLALANEIEVQAPWVDVSALAASISETPVTIKEKTPESIFTLATFVPTHMQSYIDLNTEAIGASANIITQDNFELDTPSILDVGSKVFNDSELVSNVTPDKLNTDIDSFLKTPKDDRSLNTPPPSKVQQNIEINPANSVLFNTDLDLEDTLLFDNEPPSDMYVVRTENIFGKEIAKRNALEQLAADSGICSCKNCKCDPDGDCTNCAKDSSSSKGQPCTDDTCSCVECKCDHESMKCAVGCGRATDTNHNTFLHYHRRHNNSNLEELGVYTLHECEEEVPKNETIDTLTCNCENGSVRCGSVEKTDNSSNAVPGSNNSKSCCVTICFKKFDAFKQFLADNDNMLQAFKAHNLNMSTSL
jgi:hypothetical protein